MATDTLKAGIPFLSLDSGMQIVFEAIDPTTGASVAGVIVSGVAIYANDLSTPVEDGSEPLKAGLLPG
jgi:hypothetical protein